MKRCSIFLILICCGITLPCMLTAPARASYAPDWYINPPLDTPLSLLGVGDGEERQDAVASALNQIASRLRTTISSHLEVHQDSLKENDIESSSQQVTALISSDVERIQFNNYQIRKEEVINNRTYTLVEVNKRIFLNEKRAALEKANQEIVDRFESLDNKPIIQQLMAFDLVLAKALDAEGLVFLIASIDPSFPLETYLNRYAKINSRYRNIRSRIKVFINPPQDLELANFVQIIKEAINNSNIKIALRRDPNDKDLVSVLMKGNVRKYTVYGNKMVKVGLRFTVLSNNNTVVSSNFIETKGVSVIGYDEAIKSAGLKFHKLLEKKNIYGILGLSGKE